MRTSSQIIENDAPFFINYVSNATALLNEYEKITKESFNLINEFTKEDVALRKETIEKLKRRSETLKNLVDDHVMRLNEDVSKLQQAYRSTLKQDIPKITSVGDTPIVSKTKSNFSITEPPSRDSLASNFKENVQSVDLTPITNSNTKTFFKLENIAETSGIPEFNIDETIVESIENIEEEMKENRRGSDQIPFVVNT